MAKLVDIEGIGETYAAKLQECGVSNQEQLLEQGATPTGRKKLTEASGISEKLILRELKIITYPTHCEQGEYPQTIFPNPIGAQSVFQSCSWLLA